MLLVSVTFTSCTIGEAEAETDGVDAEPVTGQPRAEVVRAYLFGDADGQAAFARVRERFEAANPGYAMEPSRPPRGNHERLPQ